MDNASKTVALLQSASTELGVLSGNSASVRIRNDLDSNHQGGPAMTVTIHYHSDGAEFSTFSTSAMQNMQAYLRGFTHALQLVTGNYAFKPVSEAAKKRPRTPVMDLRFSVPEVRPQIVDPGLGLRALRRVNLAKGMPRFAFQRCKFKQED